jgi:phosphoglycolate phosphatase
MLNETSKFIVWDWNGTLLDDAEITLECVNIILDKVGHPRIDMQIFRDAHAIPLEQFYRKIGFREEDIPGLIESERHSFHDSYEPRAETLSLRLGAAEVLGHAHASDVRSVILSNHLTDPIRKQLKRLMIDDYFHEVLAYASREIQFKDMTKGERLRRFIGTHGLTNKNAIIIGDTDEEVRIGRALGLGTVAITGGVVSERRLREAGPDHLIHDLKELKPVLQERGMLV